MVVALGAICILLLVAIGVWVLPYLTERLEARNAESNIELYKIQKELADIEADYRKRLLEDKLRLLNAQLTDKVVRLKVLLRNGVTVNKEFTDVIRYADIDRPYIQLANEKANEFIKAITDDDGSIEKGDTIYPSHMIESIQRLE